MVANRLTPTAVWAPPGVTLSNVSAGGSHTCAEGSDDKLYCWGGNSYGQLGNGTTNGVIFATAVSAPAQVTLVNPSLGEHHTCAESLDGDVYCWGRNNLGQLGNGDSGVTSSSVPVKVTGLPTGTKLSNLRAGYAHTCALGSNGKIYCWGNNAYGQFGEGRTVVSSWVPLPATTSPGASIASLTAGQDFTCASVNGELRCWGRNYYGQAGVGTTTDRYLPSQVHAPVGVTLREPTAGPDFTCARGSDGKAYCWGRNASFNLGDGTGTDRLTPVIVAGMRGK